MRACTPDRDGYVEIDGIKAHYEIFGEGNEPTVLLMNGWQLATKQQWKAQVPYLARHYRVVTFDNPGNGRSDRPAPEWYSNVDQAASMQALLDATCPTPPIMVGISGGAVWTFMMAAMAPDSVRAIVLIGGPWLRPEDLTTGQWRFLDLIEPLWDLESRPDDDDGWKAFVDRFLHGILPESHSTKLFEDVHGWASTADRPGLVASMRGLAGDEALASLPEAIWSLAPLISCPALVVHGTADIVAPAARAEEMAALLGADAVILEDAGHCPPYRDPVVVNRVVREFVDRVHPPAPRRRTWSRALTRPKRALFLCSPVGLGHARRDLAIADALRRERPDVQIDWLAQHPVTAVLDAHGETMHPASRVLVSESAHWESECGEHDLHAFQALRRMDEILVANFMVFDDVMRDDTYDLVVADEAWDVDYFLHENPELKRFALAWLTDFVGYLPMDDTDASLAADYNAEMIEQVARYPRLRDRSLFVGDAADIVPDAFGPGLPSIASWTAEHFSFPGYITGCDVEDRDALRAELGYRDDETVCIVTVGGSGVGTHLLRKAVAAHPLARKQIPSLRTIAVCGPRIDPASIDAPPGVEVRAFVPDLHRHLQACDVAVVQGGLTTCMELTAAGRPFLYFPLANHFEQQRHVAHRLDRYRAGRRMDYADSTPDAIADALTTILRQPVDYLPVTTDGAKQAGSLLAELI